MFKFNFYFFFIFFVFLFNLHFICCLDYGHNWQVSFQDPATPTMEGIISLHHDLMFILIIIGSFVTWLLIRTTFLFHFRKNKLISKINHNFKIEMIWTITPALVLMVIAIPSFALLYSIDETVDPCITLKIIGHQWYWSYEYNDFSNIDGKAISFDSYMLENHDLIKGKLKLLEVDNKVVLPIKVHVRLLITAMDVLHCWSIPSFGVKLDACPGRLNEISIYLNRQGFFFGQCSEICGIQHGFMPIVVESMFVKNFIQWINVQTECQNWIANKIHAF